MRLAPPPQSDNATVALAPRYAGDRLPPATSAPVTVNIFSVPPGTRPDSGLSGNDMTLIGVGEVYATREAAAATGTLERAAGGT